MKLKAIAPIILFVLCAGMYAQSENDASYFYSKGNEFYDAGDYDSAIEYYKKAIPLYEKKYGVNSMSTASCYSFIGYSYLEKGEDDSAILYLKKAIAMYESPQCDILGATDKYYELGGIFFRKAEYDFAIEYYKKALPLCEKKYGMNDMYTANCYSFLGYSYLEKGEINAALPYCQKALKVFESSNDNIYFAANVYHYIGTAYDKNEEYDKAISYYEKALVIRKTKEGKNEKEEAKLYRSIGRLYVVKTDFNEALKNLEKAFEIMERIGAQESRDFVGMCDDIGAYYFETGEFETALEWNEKAYDLLSKFYDNDIDMKEILLTNRGAVYRSMNNNEEAEKCYKMALEIALNIYGENSRKTATCYFNIADIYKSKGDYDRAISHYEKTIEIIKSLFWEKHDLVAKSYNSIGRIYRSKDDYDLALSYFNKAVEMYVSLFGENNRLAVQYYSDIGSIYSNKKQYQKAFECYYKACKIVEKLPGDNTDLMADLWESCSIIKSAEGNREQAIKMEKIALELYKKKYGDLNTQTSNAYMQLAISCAGNLRTEEAIEYYRKAFEGYRVNRNYASILSNLKMIIENARLYRLDEHPEFISETLDLFSQTLECTRFDLQSIKQEILFDFLPLYYYGVDFEAKNGNPYKAFEYSESLRSRGFLDQIGTEAAFKLNGITDAERADAKNLLKQISDARNKMETQNSLPDEERNQNLISKAVTELFDAEKKLENLEESISKRLPKYTQLRNPKPISAKTAQKWCGNGKVILEYVLKNQEMEKAISSEFNEKYDFKSYCIVITKKTIVAIPLDESFDYAGAVTKLRENIIPKNARAKPAPEVVFEDVRNELYEKLIEPVIPYIKGKSQILIVPDGSLSFLPFDALRNSENEKMLCEQYAVSLSPSVSVSMISDASRAKELKMLAFGGAWYDSTLSSEEHRRTFDETDASRGQKRGFQLINFELEYSDNVQKAAIYKAIQENGPAEYFNQKNLRWMDLPGTLSELNSLKGNIFTGSKYHEYTQENATEFNLKSLSKDGTLAKYSVLHFACHGYFYRSFAELSSILFSEVSGKLGDTSSNDGYLTIPEVSELNLDADMVCLSACETGLGEVKVGDGMTGLNRAFMVAGARHVGVTLWSVDDEATAEFMASMYKKVERNGMTYEQAYRRTKAEFQRSEDYSHPYYWSAFVLYE